MMNNIKYNIKLNHFDRPYLELIDNAGSSMEDKFFAIEIVRYLFRNILTEKEKPEHNIDANDLNTFRSTTETIERISDEMAYIVYEQMLRLGDSVFDYVDKYHIKVNNINELADDLVLFQNEDKLYQKIDGLKVFVIDEKLIYRFNSELNSWEPEMSHDES